MAIRDQLRANAASVLEPGEEIHAVFAAQTTSQWWSILSYWIIIVRSAYRAVVVTDRRILVCRSGRIKMSQVNEVLRTLPRGTTIGPATGLWYKCDSLGERLYVHKRWHKDIEAADALAGSTPAS
jgi:hypothetical protein